MAKTNLHAFKAKDTRFMADGLKSKGLHKLWHVRMLSIKPCLHTQLQEHNKSYLKVSRGGAFDHLEWTYDGAFEQLFGLGRGEFSKNFPKIQMPGGLPGGDVEASI